MRIGPILDDAHFVRTYAQYLGFKEAREFMENNECPAGVDPVLCQAQKDALDSVIEEMEEAFKTYASEAHPQLRPSIA